MATSTKAQFNTANSEDTFAYLATAQTFTLKNTFGEVALTGRFQTDKGADIASGGIITLGADGNIFDITGVTTINEILATGWQVGSTITLQFDGILTVTHNSGGTNDILLGNQANMTTAVGDTLTLFFDGTDWVEVSYEGYGPEGIAVIVEVATDNKNRTIAEIKNLFERGGGSLSSPGAVAFQFKKSGLMTIEKNKNPDEQILKLMDLEVDDVQEVNDAIEIYAKPELLRETRKKVEQMGFKVLSGEMVMEPLSQIKIKEPQKAERVLKFTEALEEHDDVQKVYVNFDIPDEILNQMEANK